MKINFPHGKPLGIRRTDFIIIAVVLSVIAALLLGRALFSRQGRHAVITAPAGEYTLDLDKDTMMTLDGNNGITVIIQVQSGRARFQQSNCPDQICVNSGWLSKSGQSAACLPAGIALRITGGASDVDAITG